MPGTVPTDRRQALQELDAVIERYLLRYDPHARQVEVRRGSGSGELLLGVADGTDPAEVVAFVATLGG
jgi:hypothetical protein